VQAKLKVHHQVSTIHQQNRRMTLKNRTKRT